MHVESVSVVICRIADRRVDQNEGGRTLTRAGHVESTSRPSSRDSDVYIKRGPSPMYGNMISPLRRPLTPSMAAPERRVLFLGCSVEFAEPFQSRNRLTLCCIWRLIGLIVNR